MYKWRKELNSSFFTLSIHLGCVDLFMVAQKLVMQTLAIKYYPNFALSIEMVCYLNELETDFPCSCSIGQRSANALTGGCTSR